MKRRQVDLLNWHDRCGLLCELLYSIKQKNHIPNTAPIGIGELDNELTVAGAMGGDRSWRDRKSSCRYANISAT